MRQPLLLFVALLFAPALGWAQVHAPAQKAPANLDFEAGSAGATPPHWSCPSKGFEAKTVEGDVRSGSRAASLRSAPAATEEQSPFGNLMQAVDAAPYRGRWIRLRAAVKLKAATEASRTQLWMRVDRPERKMGFFDNMGQRPIRGASWSEYEITGDVADDATTLNFGIILLSGGEAFIDDVTITDLGKVFVTTEAPRAATGRGLDNLAAFARLLGYVRHFHPSDQAEATDWDRFAVEGVRRVEGSGGPADLANTLNDLFRPVAPTVQVYVTSAAPKTNDRLPLSSVAQSSRVERFVPGSVLHRLPGVSLAPAAGDGARLVLPSAQPARDAAVEPRRDALRAAPPGVGGALRGAVRVLARARR